MEGEGNCVRPLSFSALRWGNDLALNTGGFLILAIEMWAGEGLMLGHHVYRT